MSWTTDDFLDVEENDLEWFESNPDRILRRRTAFQIERDLPRSPVTKLPTKVGIFWQDLPASETLWTMTLRNAPFVRLYYYDPKDFYDYGEPAINDDYTLMIMWDEIARKGGLCATAVLSERGAYLQQLYVGLAYLQGFKAAMIDYRKHQRATLKLN